jgi:hypothetical protein
VVRVAVEQPAVQIQTGVIAGNMMMHQAQELEEVLVLVLLVFLLNSAYDCC